MSCPASLPLYKSSNQSIQTSTDKELAHDPRVAEHSLCLVCVLTILLAILQNLGQVDDTVANEIVLLRVLVQTCHIE